MDEIKQLLTTAIQEKRCVKAVYQGYTRYLCPHGLGYKGAKVNLMAYQYAGDTSKGPVKQGSGHAENWRCMDISQLQSVEIIEGAEWHTSDNHSRPSTCIDQFIAQVSH